MIRFIHAHRTGQLSNLGNFKLRGSEDQGQAALDLYFLFLESKGSPTLECLRNAKHKLFAALLQPPSLSEDVIGCPTDQTLFLTCILPDGRYQIAKNITGLCAAAQYCFRSIICHVVRLEADDEDVFTLWNAEEREEDQQRDWCEPDLGENDDDIEDYTSEEEIGFDLDADGEDMASDEFGDDESLDAEATAKQYDLQDSEFDLFMCLIVLIQGSFARRKRCQIY